MPTLFTRPNTVACATSEILPLNVGFASLVQAGDALATPASVLTQDGGGNITLTDSPTILASAVVASPAPTVTSFALTPGDGSKFLQGAPAPLGAGLVLTVGTQVATVATIVGDLVTLQAPLSVAPIAGQAVTSTQVQQIIRGSALTAKQNYRLDVTVTLNTNKKVSQSTNIQCPR